MKVFRKGPLGWQLASSLICSFLFVLLYSFFFSVVLTLIVTEDGGIDAPMSLRSFLVTVAMLMSFIASLPFFLRVWLRFVDSRFFPLVWAYREWDDSRAEIPDVLTRSGYVAVETEDGLKLSYEPGDGTSSTV